VVVLKVRWWERISWWVVVNGCVRRQLASVSSAASCHCSASLSSPSTVTCTSAGTTSTTQSSLAHTPSLRSVQRGWPASFSTRRIILGGRRTGSTPRLRSVCGTEPQPTTTPFCSSRSECYCRSSSQSSATGASSFTFSSLRNAFSSDGFRQEPSVKTIPLIQYRGPWILYKRLICGPRSLRDRIMRCTWSVCKSVCLSIYPSVPCFRFSARDSIAYMLSALYAVTRLSVCLSHGWISQKPLKLGLCNSHLTVPHPSFCWVSFIQKFYTGSPWAGASNKGGVEKTNHFLALNVNISKTVQIRPKLLLMTNRKLHKCAFDWHQDRWPWMTLNCYIDEFCGISQFCEVATAKQMKIVPYCQRQRCNPLNVCFNIIFLALICRRFLR